MKANKKKTIFVCQITQSRLKVIKCLSGNNSKREFAGLEVATIPPDIDDKTLTEELSRIFKKLEYNNNPLIISLPRNQATCRYLKVPTQTTQEIDKIVSLQASRYLPYPAHELITGYQVISTDKQGYADISLTIVHKDVIERYVKIFQELGIRNLTIILSSYGLSQFYSYIEPERPSNPVMIVDIDFEQMELAIISGKKLLFSRYAKLVKSQPKWEDSLIEEINKTQDAYLKEISQERPAKIIVIDERKASQEITGALKKQTTLPVEALIYHNKINLPENLLHNVLNSDDSFASLMGLGLQKPEESLNLLPPDIKREAKKISQRKEYLRIVLFIAGITLILGVGIAKNSDNKSRYIKRLKAELNKIAKEAKPLEEIDQRLKLLEGRLQKRPSSLDVLYELHQIIPDQIVLTNLTYEEDNQVILHGQSPQLNSVFKLVSQLEKSTVFKNFNIKVRYATQKKTQTGEIIEFEIVCLKEK